MSTDVNELKRFYCVVDYITNNQYAYVTMFDSQCIQDQYTCVIKVSLLEEKGLRVHVEKNFHLVIYVDGSWNIYYIINNFMNLEQQIIIEGALNSLCEIYYKKGIKK